jgi:hypothetical protein
MLIGIGMTALSYLTTVFSTAPNQKYIAFVGIIIAGAFMFMSTGHD